MPDHSGLDGDYVPAKDIQVDDYLYVGPTNIPCRVLRVGRARQRNYVHVSFRAPAGVSVEPTFRNFHRDDQVFRREKVYVLG